MSELLESAVREAFLAESQLAPDPHGLARTVQRRARRRPLILGTAGVASLSVAAGLAIANPFASPRPPVASAHGALPVSGAQSCVEEYSPETLKTLMQTDGAFAFDGTVTRAVPLAALADLPVVAVTFDVHEWFHGGAGATTTIEMSPPAPTKHVTGESEIFDSYGVGTRLLVSGVPRWPGHTPSEPVAWSCGFTRYYDAATAGTWRETLAR